MGIVSDIAICGLALLGVWGGAKLIVVAVDDFSKRLRFSSFAVSFVLLGILTSIPELSVGLTSISRGVPEVFVGNLLGGIFVLFLFVIPLLALVGGKVRLDGGISKNTLILVLGVIMAPAVLILDQKINSIEGLLLIVAYIVLSIWVEMKKGFFDKKHTKVFDLKAYSYMDIVKVVVGVGVVLLAGQVVVTKTILFSQILGLPVFFVSLVFLSLGTNLPEISLAITSIRMKKKEIAFGDYLGSASANTLFFGIFALMSGGEIVIKDRFEVVVMFMLLALGSFYFFIRSNKELSRKEGLMLMILYGVFCVWESMRR
jgi:cation:H+ antiporter